MKCEHISIFKTLIIPKDENIGFDGYIGTWILLIYISDIAEIYQWIFLHEYRYIGN